MCAKLTMLLRAHAENLIRWCRTFSLQHGQAKQQVPLTTEPAASVAATSHVQYILVQSRTGPRDEPSDTRNARTQAVRGGADAAAQPRRGTHPDRPQLRLLLFPHATGNDARGAAECFWRRPRRPSTPVLVQIDTEHWWEARPDLWNWWDPARPGLRPGQSRERGMDRAGRPTHAIKIAWRNWGQQIRVLPPPNLASPRYTAACREEIRRLVPVVMDLARATAAGQETSAHRHQAGARDVDRRQRLLLSVGQRSARQTRR